MIERDRRARAVVAAIAAARTAGRGPALGRAVRRLQALRRHAGADGASPREARPGTSEG